MKKQIYLTIAISGVLLLLSSSFNSCIQEGTFSKATIETNQVTSVTEATAICGGVISGDGGSNVTARGVCWSTSPNPTIENDTTIDAAGTGQFSSLIKGLSPSTTYYVRAYAVNKGGAGYGLQMAFTTKIFSITTAPIDTSLVTANSAICGGHIISDGESSNLTVNARGVCWNTFPSPTIDNSKTLDGVGVGEFTSKIDSLKALTTYYVRAYATIGSGTIYGNEVSFTTLSDIIETSWRDDNLAFFDGLANHSDIDTIGVPNNGHPCIYYKVLTPGTGHIPIIGNMVKVTYAGWLWNDTVKYNSPLDLKNALDYNQIGSTFRVGTGVIDGWSLVLQHMPVGSKWRVFIPYYLGYGSSGTSSIPAYSTLIFEITLKEITSEN